MSEAVDLIKAGYNLSRGHCCICKEIRDLYYSLKHNIDMKFCTNCYSKIPGYIPLQQDSQYIELMLERKKL